MSQNLKIVQVITPQNSIFANFGALQGGGEEGRGEASGSVLWRGKKCGGESTQKPGKGGRLPF
jgi:hypothetical protein